MSAVKKVLEKRNNVNCLIPSRKNSALHEILALFDITRILLPPTRITSTSATSIDMVCTNFDTDKIKIEVINTDLSDHTGQFCHIQVKLKTYNPYCDSKAIQHQQPPEF
uniref:Uncharacterized protein n=1 Tax=Cuerna arida TaxID=1464854 RepID=A0A1B6GZB3_9HEMI